LLGWVSDAILLVLFDTTGALVETREWPVDLVGGLGPEVEARVNEQIRAIQVELGFEQGPICVQPFFVDKFQAGIKELPEDLGDFVFRPHMFSREEAKLFVADIEAWRLAGNFVLRWNDDVHMRRDGYTL